ncbi:hypothetical protein ACFV2U_41670 [Streptomyces sp. NPDC059697]|uniref:hypothetical protein n=1 Tax=Streptomyces sp. NPDC059697 TaxID=3346912 RepID=UPI00369B8CB4
MIVVLFRILSQAHAALGQRDQARDACQKSLALYHAQHRTADAERVQRQLDDLDHPPNATQPQPQ